MATLSFFKDLTLPNTARDHESMQAMGVPFPQESPASIMQNLMAFRNERVLHRRKCDFTGDTILSAYRANTPFPVYTNQVWWGDSWDPLQYGREFDFSRPFFEQFAELQQVVPREGTSVFNSENCEYNGHIRESKNCYMSALIYRCEDTHYSYWGVNNKDVVDCFLVNNSTLAYECIDCENIYDAVGLQDCLNCQDCYFSFQLTGCSNCIACCNLVKKSYHVFNKPVSPAEFSALKAKILSGTKEGFNHGKALFQDVWKTGAHRATHNLQSEDVLGDHLRNCRRCTMCFDANEGEDCSFAISFGDSRDIRYCYSAGWPRCEGVFQSAVTRGSTDIAFCYYIFFSSGLRYCDSMTSCHDCFGCIGLRQKRYCILNREYPKDQFMVLRDRIIEHMKRTNEWGRYFPITLSTFPYNDTAAQQFFPMTEQEIVARGWKWGKEEEMARTITPVPFPEKAIAELPESITDAVFVCEKTKKPFRIAKQELLFYRKMNLPLPRICPDERYRSRVRQRNPLELFSGTCQKTGKNVVTSFPPNSNLVVYSEEAYLESLG